MYGFGETGSVIKPRERVINVKGNAACEFQEKHVRCVFDVVAGKVSVEFNFDAMVIIWMSYREVILAEFKFNLGDTHDNVFDAVFGAGSKEVVAVNGRKKFNVDILKLFCLPE